MPGNCLILISCSDHKIPGGDPKNINGNTDINWLKEDNIKKKLLQTRQLIYQNIKRNKLEDAEKKQGKRGEDPINETLYDGPDLGGNDFNGLYMPAYKRYYGRFFRKLINLSKSSYDELWKGLQPQFRVLIVSALYGLLEPYDMIQEYTCHLTDRFVDNGQMLSSVWTEQITEILNWYMKKYDIKYVIDLLSEESYQALFIWREIYQEHKEVKFLHRVYKNSAGPITLINSAIYFFYETMKEKIDPEKIPVDEFIQRDYFQDEMILFEPQFMGSKKEVVREGITEMVPALKREIRAGWNYLSDAVRNQLANAEYVFNKMSYLQLFDFTTAAICLFKAWELWLGEVIYKVSQATGRSLKNKEGKVIDINKATLGNFAYYLEEINKLVEVDPIIAKRIKQEFPRITSEEIKNICRGINEVKNKYRNDYAHRYRMSKEFYEKFRKETFEFFNKWPLIFQLDK